MPLPEKFPSRAELLDVEFVPVAIGALSSPPYCAAFDVEPPRPFPFDSARRNGTAISEAEFRYLVSRARQVGS
jgi:hypothetical protein